MNIDEKIKANKNIVWQVIHDLEYIPSNVEVEDLYQIGLISLWKAIETFEEDKGYSLYTHCSKVISGDIIDSLRNSQAKKRNGSISCSDIVEPVEDTVIGTMLEEEIKSILNPLEYKLFIYKYIEGLTHNEIAQIYNVSKRTVYRWFDTLSDKLKNNLIWDMDK